MKKIYFILTIFLLMLCTSCSTRYRTVKVIETGQFLTITDDNDLIKKGDTVIIRSVWSYTKFIAKLYGANAEKLPPSTVNVNYYRAIVIKDN